MSLTQSQCEVLRLAKFYEYLVDQGIADEGYNPVTLATLFQVGDES